MEEFHLISVEQEKRKKKPVHWIAGSDRRVSISAATSVSTIVPSRIVADEIGPGLGALDIAIRPRQ